MEDNGKKTDTVANNAPFMYHAIVVDVVQYSTLTTEEQRRTAETLTLVCQSALQKVGLKVGSRCIALPTGDGVAICLVAMMAETAVELAGAIRAACFLVDPFVPIRIGVHYGRGAKYTDITERDNIAGPGINLATRVASEADPGAIVLSDTVGKDLHDTDEYRPRLEDLGERVVKHGEKERLWELCPAAGVRSHEGGSLEPGGEMIFRYRPGWRWSAAAYQFLTDSDESSCKELECEVSVGRGTLDELDFLMFVTSRLEVSTNGRPAWWYTFVRENMAAPRGGLMVSLRSPSHNKRVNILRAKMIPLVRAYPRRSSPD
jgi:class 3 adenylate cyclase